MAQAIHDTHRRHRAARAETARGALLFDPERIAEPDERLLRPSSYGQSSGESGRGGRGTVWFVHDGFGAAVLRHYRRGGALAPFNRDRYLFRGEERTRPFREFRLLQALHAQGLPVPRPLAACYARSGAFYRADILLERIDDAHTLAERLRLRQAVPWREIGALLARFHAVGAFHADLNAHNVLIDGAGAPWLIDFDRGELRSAGGWQARNLERLQRSLRKLATARGEAFDDDGWSQLLGGYRGEDLRA